MSPAISRDTRQERDFLDEILEPIIAEANKRREKQFRVQRLINTLMAAQDSAGGCPLYISRAQNIAKAATSEVIDLTGSSTEPSDDEKKAAPGSGNTKQQYLKEQHLKALIAQQYPDLNLESADSVLGSGDKRKPIHPYFLRGNECGRYRVDQPAASENVLSATYASASMAPNEYRHYRFDQPPASEKIVSPTHGAGTLAPKHQASPSPSAHSQSSGATVGTPVTTSTAVTEDAEGKEWVRVEETANTEASQPNEIAEAESDGTTKSPSPSTSWPAKEYIYALLVEYRFNTNHPGPPLGRHHEFGTLRSVTLKGLYRDLEKANGAVKQVYEEIRHRTGLSEVDALKEVEKGRSGGERLFVYLDHPEEFVSWSVYTEERVLR
ncbi:hypothetical protein G7Y79_00019g046580 [Physcia stellaris]|nr:hypothetical protein G7Y79_00019g046580 [Physcia stellaris]